MSSDGKWADLRVRVLSGLIVLVAGLGAVLGGGLALKLLAILVAGAAIWELARLTAPAPDALSAALGVFAAGMMALALFLTGPLAVAAIALPPLLGLAGPRRDRLVFALYGLATLVAVLGFVTFRETFGLAFAVWLVLVVLASDVMGYFGGRILGGPKFWPRLSPKKTWSGTVAGWLGAGAVGLAFALAYGESLILLPFSMLTAFAAQLGDIAESAIKRRAGVKDASNLIPGHGGVLDRFDALIGATLFVLAWGLVGLPLPLFQG